VNGINSLAEESDLKPRGEMVKELSRLKEENKWLADDLGLKNLKGSRRKKILDWRLAPKNKGATGKSRIPDHQPGYAARLGIFNTSRMSGVMVGPLVAGLTADAYGVSGVIVAFVAIAAAVTLLTLAVREPRRACVEGDMRMRARA
jgi:hypothetical protein